ncbi:MAG: type II toxin-antitoxin system RelE/ParE family toxin [Micrococcales bacterium]
MIVSFADKRTEAIWLRESTKRISPELQRLAQCKLRVLNRVVRVEELLIPPGNHLKMASGDLPVQCSIRVNDQWRICFTWTPAGPEAVELVDYHKEEPWQKCMHQFTQERSCLKSS